MKVCDLVPGDRITVDGRWAVYVSQCKHPIWPRYQLVIWRLMDESWSHDALDSMQDIGERDMGQPQRSRDVWLRWALLGQEVS